MSKKISITDPFQPKITRNDRFAQMSHQEKVIEQKKKEIQAKLEAKQKNTTANTENVKAVSTKSPVKKVEVKKAGINLFSNDGSFLDTFKQLKDKRLDSKLKSFKSKDSYDKNYSDRKKNSRWSQQKRSPSPKDSKLKMSRFSSEKNEPKITINTSFNSSFIQNYEPQFTLNPQNVTGQPLLKNYPQSAPVIAAPPLLLNVPPQNVLINSDIISPRVELASIPPPNPIKVQNIPPPEPLNTLNIPPPAPIQVQNIPTPNSIQLNEIPNPKPLDLLAIPTPTEGGTSKIADPNFIKNVPPPNKSVPPPNITDLVPPPPPPSTLVLPLSSLPPPQTQNLMVYTMPPPLTTSTSLQPPPTVLNNSDVTSISTVIPPLMAQPILPPPGMGLVNVNCPPPSILPSLNTPPPNYVAQQPPPPPPSITVGQMPLMNVPPPPTGANVGMINTGLATFKDAGINNNPDYEAMASLGRMVAQCGPGIEDVVRQRKPQDPNLWFLFYKESPAYQQYQQMVEQFKKEIANENTDNIYKPEDMYEPDKPIDDDDDDDNEDYLRRKDINEDCKNDKQEENGKRKRKSRWGDKDMSVPPPIVPNNAASFVIPQTSGNVMLSKINQNDPRLLQYVMTTYGSTNLSEEEWKTAEDNFKINVLYQEMLKKKNELERLQRTGKQKYDYDSDEEVDGGTWEHKLRDKEMMATQIWADELTRQAEGKHHIGDFLPPEEFKRFMLEKTAINTGIGLKSDYKESEIKEDNIGFKMMQKLGWSEGQGLGLKNTGILEPVNKAISRDQNQGLGLQDEETLKEDEYEAYRKRMMLAYRFRPNPLNNPRRPYY